MFLIISDVINFLIIKKNIINNTNIHNFKIANPPEKIKNLIELAKKRGIKLRFVTRENLDKICLNKQHEGICLKTQDRSFVDLKKFPDFQKHLKKSEGNIVVLVQDINETYTLGNIIKTGLYLGADHFILSKDDKHPLNGLLAKTSSGATETTDIFTLKFIKNFLIGKIFFDLSLIKRNFISFYHNLDAAKKDWVIVCAGVDKDNPGYSPEKKHSDNLNKKKDSNKETEMKEDESQSTLECKEINLRDLNFDQRKNYIILLRNDGSNFNTCHYKLYVPPCLDDKMVKRHPFDYIESLNTSVILGLIISSFKNKTNSI